MTTTLPPEKTRQARALGDAAYREEDFPALQLTRSARIARRTGKVLLVTLCVMVVAMLVVPWQQSIRGEGSVVALDPYERTQIVQAPIKGRIAERGPGIQESAYVQKGQLLFRIEDQDPLYQMRLEQSVQLAESNLQLAKSQLQRSEDARLAAQQIVDFATEQIEFEKQARDDLMEANDRLVDQARNKLAAAEGKLIQANAKLLQTEADFVRKDALFRDGIESELKQQEARQKFQDAEAGVEIAKQDIENARNGVTAKEKERDSKWQAMEAKIKKVAGDRQKAQQAVAKADIDIQKNSGLINDKQKSLLDAKRTLEAQKTSEVVAERDGYIMNISVVDGVSIVKPGAELCRIVPRTENPAVQVWVSGNDAPLIGEGRHVRLQFEGWPAVQFSGWPSVAVGTFGGKVQLVDPTDDGFGRFRVVVVPDTETFPDDMPWPEHPFLRQGVRANGWVLLNQVPLGYEVWRRMNGFPQALQSQSGKEGKKQKEVKAPKIKI